jgi:hypothetical protein
MSAPKTIWAEKGTVKGMWFHTNRHKGTEYTHADLAIPAATLERWSEAIRAANYWDYVLDEKNESPDPVETEIRAIIAQREKME